MAILDSAPLPRSHNPSTSNLYGPGPVQPAATSSSAPDGSTATGQYQPHTGEQPVTPKNNDAFDDTSDQYSDTSQKLISRSNFRLDLAQRIRPPIVDDEADQVIADINEQDRTVTATIKQPDGSSIVQHFDIATPYEVEAQCNSDGTFNVEKR
ncbi:hypothetical protein [Rhodococcus sp. Q]|uniref:hypothetical protein n=1 Tax=Rhodococcus sp. Q TaxID=2502252 RepID=UPI0010F63004|nr:hypothetical protein [Rhodococcus sp. Q]